MNQEARYKFGMDLAQPVLNTQAYYEFLKNVQVDFDTINLNLF